MRRFFLYLLTFSAISSLSNLMFSLNAQDIFSVSNNSYDQLYTNSLNLRNFSIQTDTGFTILGRWVWGSCSAVDVRGTHAFIGNGPTFHVLDISNPDTAIIIGEYVTDGLVQDIVIRDSLAFVVIGKSLLILNISNPSQPTRVGEVEAPASLQVALSDSIAFVTIFDGKMDIIDISNPAQPYRRNRAFGVGFLPFCLAAREGRAYIGSPSDPSMVIVDASNPDSLRRGLFHLDGWGISAYVQDTLLLVGSRLFSGGRYLRIFSIASPDTPMLLGQTYILSSNSEITGITATNNSAFLTTMDSGLVTADFSNPSQPQVRGWFKSPNLPGLDYNSGAVAVSQSSLYASYEAGMLSVDVSQLDSVTQRFFFPTGGVASRVQIRENLAFVASGSAGLWILDVAIPQYPRQISNVMTGGYSHDICVSDTIAYLLNGADTQDDTARGLWIVDISDPWQPQILSHYIGIVGLTNPPHQNSIGKENNLVFLTQQSQASQDPVLEIVDISDPHSPTQTGVLQARYSPYHIAVGDSFVYLATPDSGLRIIDARNPSLPVEVGSFAPLRAVIGIAVSGQLAFVDRVDSIFVLNVSKPHAPTVMGSTRRSGGSFTSTDLALAKDWLYWAGGDMLGAIDVSDPYYPVQRALLSAGNGPHGVASNGNLILATYPYFGVWILKNDLITSIQEHGPQNLPEKVFLSQNYPNPFNSQTAVRFYLPTTGWVRFELMNILGQTVRTPIDVGLLSGWHEIYIDAGGLSSGVYFYRLVSRQGFFVKRMLLLK